MATAEPNIRERRGKTGDSSSNNGTDEPQTSKQTGQPAWMGFPQQSTPETSSLYGNYKNFHEYSCALRQWMKLYFEHEQMNQFYKSMPYYAMGYMAGQQQQQLAQSQAGRPATGAVPQQAGGGVQQPQPGAAAAPIPQAAAQRARNYKIPAIWKRVMAEFIDFFMLFALKLGITILVIEYVGIMESDLEVLEKYLDEVAEKNIEELSELLLLAFLYRCWVCAFETLCLRRGMAGRIGGTSPGKRIMKLKVVSCTEVVDLGGNRVQVVPAGDMGFWNALVRSVIKNFSLAFFFPVCFTAFFFQHNRAAYDVIANCIVVEEDR